MSEFIPLPPAAPRQGDKTSFSLGQTIEASFESESGFVNIFKRLGEKQWQDDPNFSLADAFTARPELLPYRRYFDHVQSQAEMDYVNTQVQAEEKNRAIRQAAGLTGFVTDTLAGIFSPSTFVPFGAAAKGIGAVGKVAGLAAGSAALDEVVLQSSQYTRTAAESAANVMATAALGAVLGTAVHMLTPREVEIAAQAFGDQTPVRAGGSINAAEVEKRLIDPGQLQGVLTPGERAEAGAVAKIKDRVLRIGSNASTVMRNQINEIPMVRAVQAAISDAGLQFSRGMDNMTAVGGTAESRIAMTIGQYKNAGVAALEDSYVKYFSKKQEFNALDKLRAESIGLVPKQGRYSRDQFAEQVFLEMNKPQSGQIKEIADAAEAVRKAFYEPLGKLAQEVGLLAEGIDPAKDGYINHVFRKDLIEKDPTGFLAMLERNYQQVMSEAYAKRLEKVNNSRLAADTDIADLSRSDEEVREIQSDINAKRLDYLESEAFDIQYDRAQLRRELRELRKLPSIQGPGTNPASPRFPIQERISEIEDRIRYLDSLIDEDMEAAMKAENARRRRSTLLSRAIGRLTARQEHAMARLEDYDLQSIARMRKSLNKVKTFLETSEGLSDEAYAKGIGALEEDFHAAVAKMEQTEARAQKYRDAHPELQSGETAFIRRIQRFRSQILGGGKMVLDDEASRMQALEKLDAALAEGDRWTPQQLKSIQELREDIAKAHIGSAEDLEAAFDKAWVLENQNYNAIGRTHIIAEQLESAAQQGPEYARRMLDEWYNDTLTDVADRLMEVGRRQDRMREKIKGLDPELTKKRIETIRLKKEEQGDKLAEWLRKQGGELDENGAPVFTEGGKEFARGIKQSIMGDPVRVVGMDLGAERGAELARVLDIPIEEKMAYLETDVDKLVRIYSAHVIPDIELSRAGLGVNGAKALEKVRAAFEKAIADTAGIEDVTKREAEAKRLNRNMEATLESFVGQIQRLRHQRGQGANPDGYLYRGGRMLQDLNVATMMGNVLTSSLVDPATAVVRYGVRRVFRHGLKPFIGQLKELRMSQREAKYAGLNELMDQNRLYQLSELMEDTGRRTRGEKALTFVANKIGTVGLFSYWTQYMKEWTAPIVAGKVLDAVETFNVGSSKYMKMDEARNVLAHMHIDGDLAQRIWRQYENGGIVKHGDLWVPNTQAWNDAGAREAFHTAMISEINSTIVTPGVENPLFLDSSMFNKLLFQFQSFMWSSNTKVLMAGVQRQDYHLMEGILAGFGLGAMAYAVDSISRGRWDEAKEEGFDVWADEIIARSPFLGVLSQGLKIGQATPARPLLQFSDKGAERRYSDSFLGAVAGPSFTTLKRMSKIAAEIDDPTQSTANTVRQLTPYNNVIFVRQLFDMIVENSGLPATRD